MTVATVILIILVVILLFVVAMLFLRFSSLAGTLREVKDAQGGEKMALLLKEDLRGIHERLDRQSESVQKSIQSQLGESAKIVRDVTERLTKLDETNRQVVNFSDQLRDLQDILQNPKQRGELGEFFLEQLLGNVLAPGQWKAQYEFKNGETVDAAIFVKDKIIPVDAKFSLENYNRLLEAREPAERDRLEKLFKADVKNRIDEASKYIRPDEGTLDFSFMFIPAEAIYYDLLVNKVGAAKINTRDLIEYAFKEKKVIIVSPTSFLAYLQTVLQGLRAMKIEESAAEIRTRVEQLGKHLQSYDVYLQKLGTTLSTTVNHYNAAYKEFAKIEKDVVKIADVEAKVEPMQLEKPSTDA